MIYCTHSDKNYLAKGIALCNNIIEHDKDAEIYYLCTDDTAYDRIVKINNNKIQPIYITELLLADKKLLDYKMLNHKSNYGDSYAQFCWALTPYLCSLILSLYDCKKQGLLYCDADLYFYKSPQLIKQACLGKAVGIHTHGFSSYDPETNDVGEFNVGCVYFDGGEKSFEIAETWKNWLLNPQNEYAEKYGTCGDQKYLDLFIPLFGSENIAVFDRDTSPVINHGAPWNFSNYEYKDEGIYKSGENIELVFNHFSHFNADFTNENGWRSSNNGEWKPEELHKKVYDFYFNYNKKLMETNTLLQNA